MSATKPILLSARVLGRWFIIAAAAVLSEILIVQSGRHYEAEVLSAQGDLLVNKSQYDQAGRYATWALQDNPRHGYALFYEGLSKFFSDDYVHALDIFTQSALYMPHLPNVLRVMAESNYLLKQYDVSSTLYEQYYRMVPHPNIAPATTQKYRTDALYKTDKYGQAAVQFAASQARNTSDTEVMISRCVNAVLLNEPVFGRFVAERMINQAPGTVIDVRELFSGAVAMNKVPAAVALLNGLITDGRSVQQLAPVLALGYVRLNRLNDAVAVMEKAIAQFPSDPDLYMALGDIYQQQGNSQKALQNYNQHLKLKPDSPFRDEIMQKTQKSP